MKRPTRNDSHFGAGYATKPVPVSGLLLLAMTLLLSGCVFWRTASVVEGEDKTVFTYTIRAAGFAFHAGELMKQHDVIALTLKGRKDVYRDDEIQVTVNGSPSLRFHGMVGIDRLKRKVTIKSSDGIGDIPDGVYSY